MPFQLNLCTTLLCSLTLCSIAWSSFIQFADAVTTLHTVTQRVPVISFDSMPVIIISLNIFLWNAFCSAIDFQSHLFTYRKRLFELCLLGDITFLSFCTFYKVAGLLEDGVRRSDFLFWENKVSIAMLISIRVFWNVTLCGRVSLWRRLNGRSFIFCGRRRIIPTSDSWLVLLSVAQSVDVCFAFTGGLLNYLY
jgi:hypothetical protein